MYDIYALARGPLAWGAFIVFFGGIIYRLTAILLEARKKDHVVYAYFSPYYAMRSMLHWIVPFGSRSTRQQPVLTIVTFAFHICLIGVPLFLFAHIILLKESFDLSWWTLSGMAGQVMTIIVLLSCVYFFVRRIIQPDVRFLSSTADYLILLLVAFPFATGFWAARGWAGFEIATLLHMLSGELLLALIPFTKLSHMFFFPLTRIYAGSEFGAVRNAKDW
ncbi:MAG: nitrate reductase [Desulfosalsimonadaceae bacterium]